MVDERRQGSAILVTMGTLYLGATFALAAFEFASNGTAPQLAGAAHRRRG